MLANDIMQVLLSSGVKKLLERATDSMGDETSCPIYSQFQALSILYVALVPLIVRTTV